MGVFKFFKKRGEPLNLGSLENIELPPLPGQPLQNPTLEEEEEFFASIPEKKAEEGYPAMPELPPLPSEKSEKKYAAYEFEKIQPLPKLAEFEIPSPAAEEEVPEKLPPLEEAEVEGLPAPSKRLFPKEIEKPIIAEHEEGLEIMRRMPAAPLFVHVDNYQQLINNISSIRNSLKDSDNIFLRLNEIKNTQNSTFEKFRNTLEDVERKLIFIDKSLFEAS